MKIERINELFARYAEQLLRVRWWTLGAFVLVIILSVIGMNRMVKETLFDDYFIEDNDTRWTKAMVQLCDKVLRNPKKIGYSFLVICLLLCIGLWKIEAAFDIERTMGTKVDYVKEVMDVGRSELGSLDCRTAQRRRGQGASEPASS